MLNNYWHRYCAGLLMLAGSVTIGDAMTHDAAAA